MINNDRLVLANIKKKAKIPTLTTSIQLCTGILASAIRQEKEIKDIQDGKP